MSFTINSVAGGAQTGGITLPDYVSFTVSDSGAGGTLFINGQGVNDPTVTGAADLKTIFTGVGMLFRSIPLLRAFRSGPTTDTQAMNQFLANLEIVITTLVNTTSVVRSQFFAAESGISGPYVALSGPADAGTWRIDMRLRHSITN